jgi:site-specific DNA-methyltransferase (adenine-specific)
MADSGGASRYFFRVAEQLDAADPVRYCAKASRAERDAGLEGMPVKMVHRAGHGNNEPDPKTQAFITRCRNVHPTVKPLALTRYLATLLLPPPEYAPRRILVPFAGVASECIGAMQAGWEGVVGIEREADYCEIGRKRLDYYAGRRGLFARREAEPVVAQTALC